jgi:adenylosuccinate lyase
MLNRYAGTLKQLEVDTEQMLRNIEYTQGVVFAQGVLNHVIQQGLDRSVAYDIIQGLAMSALKNRSSFRDALLSDVKLKPYLKTSEIDAIFNPETYLKHVDAIYQNVFKV